MAFAFAGGGQLDYLKMLTTRWGRSGRQICRKGAALFSIHRPFVPMALLIALAVCVPAATQSSPGLEVTIAVEGNTTGVLDCHTSPPGRMFLSAGVEDGVAPFSFVWSTGETGSMIFVDEPGIYSVSVTDDCGCVGSASRLVEEDYSEPGIELVALPSSAISCASPVITLQATASGVGPFWFVWSTGYAEIWMEDGSPSTSSIAVSSPGTYSVEVRDYGGSGCYGEASLTVEADTDIPLVEAGPDRVLSCRTTEVTLSAIAPGGESYLWSPGGQVTPSITVSEAGTYTVVVTGANGCTNSDSVVVTQDAEAPYVDAGFDRVLSCDTTEVTLVAVAPEAESFLWNPGRQVTSSITVSEPGTYEVIVTAANGCQASDVVRVTEEDQGATATLSIIEPIAATMWAEPTADIKWEVGGFTCRAGWVRVEFRAGPESDWATLVARTENDGIWSWQAVPRIMSDECRVRVTSLEHTHVRAISEQFTISLPSEEQPAHAITQVSPADRTELVDPIDDVLEWELTGMPEGNVQTRVEIFFASGENATLIAMPPGMTRLPLDFGGVEFQPDTWYEWRVALRYVDESESIPDSPTILFRETWLPQYSSDLSSFRTAPIDPLRLLPPSTTAASIAQMYVEHYVVEESHKNDSTFAGALLTAADRNLDYFMLDVVAEAVAFELISKVSFAVDPSGTLHHWINYVGDARLAYSLTVELPAEILESDELREMAREIAGEPLDVPGIWITGRKPFPPEYDLAVLCVAAAGNQWGWSDPYTFVEEMPVDYYLVTRGKPDPFVPDLYLDTPVKDLFYSPVADPEEFFRSVWKYLYYRFDELARMADDFYSYAPPFSGDELPELVFRSDIALARAELAASRFESDLDLLLDDIEMALLMTERVGEVDCPPVVSIGATDGASELARLGTPKEFVFEMSDCSCDLRSLQVSVDGADQGSPRVSPECEGEVFWSYTFGRTGEHVVSATVNDAEGQTGEAKALVTVCREPGTRYPEAEEVYPVRQPGHSFVYVPMYEPVTFEAYGMDESCDLIRVDWMLDGEILWTEALSGFESYASWTHTFTDNSPVKVKAVFVDATGHDEWASWSVLAVLRPEATGSPDPDVLWTASAGVPVELVVHASSEYGKLYKVEWFWNSELIATDYISETSSASIYSGEISRSFSFTSTGYHSVKGQVVDRDGLSVSLEWGFIVSGSIDPEEPMLAVERVLPPERDATTGVGRPVYFGVHVDAPRGNLESVVWYVDGESIAEWTGLAYGSSRVFPYQFDSPGEYWVVALARLETGLGASKDWVVTVE